MSKRSSFIAARAIAVALVLCSMAIVGSTAWAAESLSREQTLKAERLGEAGVSAFETGRYDEALKALEEGYELSGWSTIGLWLGKTLEKLNQPLEAYRVYIDVAQTQPGADEPAPLTRAREEAQAAVARLELVLAVIQIEAPGATAALSVQVDGKARRLSRANTIAVAAGSSKVEVQWESGNLPPKVYTLAAGQRERIQLAETKREPERRDAPAKPLEGAAVQTLDFNMVELQGWSLYDGKETLICELPCKWSGTDADTLSVRHGETRLPVKLGRRYAKQENLMVSVNPARGSKGWALGVGIPSGVLFLGSLVALGNPDNEYPGVAATGTVVFGAGLGLCTWWFIWSKSRPYLDYEMPPTTPKTASVGFDFYGHGLGVSGTFW